MGKWFYSTVTISTYCMDRRIVLSVLAILLIGTFAGIVHLGIGVVDYNDRPSPAWAMKLV